MRPRGDQSISELSVATLRPPHPTSKFQLQSAARVANPHSPPRRWSPYDPCLTQGYPPGCDNSATVNGNRQTLAFACLPRWAVPTERPRALASRGAGGWEIEPSPPQSGPVGHQFSLRYYRSRRITNALRRRVPTQRQPCSQGPDRCSLPKPEEEEEEVDPGPLDAHGETRARKQPRRETGLSRHSGGQIPYGLPVSSSEF